MPRKVKGGRRPVVFWAICPGCFTYTWLEESSLVGEGDMTCSVCDSTIPLAGGARLAESCNRLQALLEDIERQISELPTPIDVHRFISDQVDIIADAFNDRLDEIQAKRDSESGGAGPLNEPADANTNKTG